MQQSSKFKGTIFGNFLCVFFLFFYSSKTLAVLIDTYSSNTLPISWSQHIPCIDLLREKEEHEVSLAIFA